MQTSNKQHQETRSLFAAVLALMVASIGCLWSCVKDTTGDPPPVDIYCTVVDSLTGVGIPDAWAAAEDTSAKYRQLTDSQGEVRFKILKGSTLTFYFGATGYTTKSKVFENVTADIQGVVIELAQ